MKLIVEFTKEDLKDDSKSSGIKLSDFNYDIQIYREANEVRYRNEFGVIVYFKISDRHV